MSGRRYTWENVDTKGDSSEDGLVDTWVLVYPHGELVRVQTWVDDGQGRMVISETMTWVPNPPLIKLEAGDLA